MPCYHFHGPDGSHGIICVRGKLGSRKRCATCGGECDFECDFPLGPSGRRTCSRGICAACRVPGKDGKDLCPAHGRLMHQRRVLFAQVRDMVLAAGDPTLPPQGTAWPAERPNPTTSYFCIGVERLWVVQPDRHASVPLTDELCRLLHEIGATTKPRKRTSKPKLEKTHTL